MWHSYQGLAEWWVLANADWLIGASGSNYAITATAWGLGPEGGMERFDYTTGTCASACVFANEIQIF